MSAVSDKYEKDLADHINKIPGITATRPKVSTTYSDVLIKKYNNKPTNTWLEVKMNHTDNLANPRVFYARGKWWTNYKTPAAAEAVTLLNKSPQAKKFIDEISNFSGITKDKIVVATGQGMLNKLPDVVPLDVMKNFFKQRTNRYVMDIDNHDLGRVTTEHYTKGKTEPVYYMSAGDDFYTISNKNPLNLSRDIPKLTGTGSFRIRVSTRSKFYEVQAEIKIKKMPNSKYSVQPGTSKLNPFLK